MNNHEEIIPSGITPIKRAKNYQAIAEKNHSEKINTDKMKSFDVVLNGRMIQIYYDGADGVIIDGKKYVTKVDELTNSIFIAEVSRGTDDHIYRIEHHDGQIYLEGRLVQFDFKPTIPKLERKTRVKSGQTLVTAPLPGNVSQINIKKGDTVKVGQRLLILEAMKMQNDILSEVDGVVVDIYINSGQQVGTNDKLLLIKNKID